MTGFPARKQNRRFVNCQRAQILQTLKVKQRVNQNKFLGTTNCSPH
uniref:UTP25 small subunit processor component n=1 Tax=Myotis myotis TaxID=51298 RepID=A0A7J7SUT0_MYOMY|nr:UTP25 small subunit processor component [Myotis myotis]